MRDSLFDYIISSDHLDVVLTTRVCAYSGRYGSGKTALAVHDTFRLLDLGAKFVYTNLHLLSDKLSIVREDREFDASSLSDCVILLDEAWLYLALDTSARELKRFLAFLRKQNLFLLLPSVLPLQRYVERAAVRVSRFYSFSWLGIPAWLYRWEIGQGRATTRGYWWWTNYARVFKLYDTKQRKFDTLYLYEIK